MFRFEPRLVPSDQIDFDLMSQPSEYLEQEVRVNRVIFDLLRGGKIEEVFEFLHQIQYPQKQLQLFGTLPMFDNCGFKRQMGSDDLFLHNFVQQMEDPQGKSSQQFNEDLNLSSIFGSRANLLFVESSLCLIQQNQLQLSLMN
mmetsp:Transcript_11669/g.19707  ORF Transcript_11669/g.19707 Transcript_11669/m.19707 type:complete len:143 (-) Transcript_11669:571-999(-)